MRSPVIAFSIFAAATVSPRLVGAAPAPPNVGAGAITGSGMTDHIPIVNGLSSGGLPVAGHNSHVGARAFDDASDAPIPPSTAGIDGFQEKDRSHRKTGAHRHDRDKRAFDAQTAGGNSYSGSTRNSSGGSVVNAADNNEALTNDTANTAGDAGASESGDAEGGRGRGRGPGGNAYTGPTAPARGGDIINEGSTIDNTGGSNTAGDGDASDSGDAFGGDAVKKRATDDRTAGGNAYSGSTGSTSSGNIVNVVDDDGTITNTGPGTNVGADSGDSTTGDAEGGRGNFKGPGGNSYSGNAGTTRGGNVINEGGTIANSATTNTAGDGADSVSGDSLGGDA